MTYSINTLKGSGRDGSPPSSQFRFAQEISLFVTALVLLFWLTALLTYSVTDSAWSTSGVGDHIHNWMGRVGAWLADLTYFLTGFSAWWLVLGAWNLWRISVLRWMQPSIESEVKPRSSRSKVEAVSPSTRALLLMKLRRSSRVLAWFGLLAASATLEWTRLHSLDVHLPGEAGGLLGGTIGAYAQSWLGFTGSALLALVLASALIAVVFKFSWGQLCERLGALPLDWLRNRRERLEQREDERIGLAASREREEIVLGDFGGLDPDAEPRLEPVPVVIEPTLQPARTSERVLKEAQKPLFDEMPDSKLPQVSLLDQAGVQGETVSGDALEMTSRLIEKKLKDFGVEVRVVAAAPGPVITRYEIEPATGVKGSQVVNLARDLARSLSLVSIRVVETIPGKNYMALELPNAKRQVILLSEVLGSRVYNDAKSMLTMGLGKDIVGNPVVADLAKMPHCLVAGTTGAGKSVGINAMILSLLYKADPQEVRLLLIDPKMLEMSVYEGIPHLLAPVVTDMRQAAHGLNWCVAEMEKRYKLMSKMGVRNLAGFNVKLQEARAQGEFIGNPFSLTPEQPEPLETLPHIVVVIDELADLMMVVGKKIEELIARLAQKARAAGIHLILATQRPSVDVITGLIKANIPTRIAFQVSSKIDSRTILDQMGAEALLGMGDMLYLPSGTGFPQRVHGAFVSDEEVHRVVAFLKIQGAPNYIDGLLEGGTVDGGDLSGSEEGSEKDPMYDQAVEIVLKNRKASISLVQRHLKIGYNRAARMLEEMENAGVVSSMGTNGQREILVPAREE
ncbi:DNA translocase FtsK 4TM domain-containing protein [Burkholderiaceae bacterium]|nr:DNA translocase FtsK 4TM domain-containing protein [Burkholderiaceae bacterium]